MDYYGLNLINDHYGPLMHRYLFHRDTDRLFENFGRFTIEEYEGHFGPLRYIIRAAPFDQMNAFLEEVKNNKKEPIWDRSVFQTFLYP